MSATYWTKQHYDQMAQAKNMAELLAVANSVVDSIPRPRVLVSGPITTGGKGTIKKNLKIFEQVIANLENEGMNVFNQLPLEGKIVEFSRDYNGYFMPVLDELFLPIFESRKIDKIMFMQDWETSKGAKWEYELAKKLRIEVDFL